MGSIVFCRTFANIWIATSPHLWIIPKTGGFSFSNVPRPREPFNLFLRPILPFSATISGGLYVRNNIDFIKLDFPWRVIWGFFLQSLHEVGSHLMDIAAVQVQFPGNLLIRKVQPHEIQAQNPDFKRLMVPEKIVSERSSKRLPHSLHHNAVWKTLSIKTSFDNQSGFTKRTPLSFRPAQLSHSVITVASSIKFFIFTCIYWPIVDWKR